jgi:hypothetical protein
MGAGINAAPAITRQEGGHPPADLQRPGPDRVTEDRMPPTIAIRLAATEVSAMTSTPGPICRPRAEA